MKILLDFNDYIIDLVLEKNSNGTLPIIFSKRLKDILEEINHPISRNLLSKEGEFEEFTLIDISDEHDKFTISISPKIYDFLSKYYNEKEIKGYYLYNYLDRYDDIWNKFRNKIKIGKFIKKLFDDRYQDSGKRGYDIESFINQYKSSYNIINIKDNLFEIVEGDDIIKWYYIGNYYNLEHDSPLHSSCMAGDECEDYLEFYSKNSDKVKMLILYSDNNKKTIVGRALLWYLTEPNRVFMDRIYYIMEHQIEIFKHYATKNEWLYKDVQNYYNTKIIDGKTQKSINTDNFYIKNMKSNRYYPYLDTLKYYYQDEKLLSMNYIEDKKEEPISLRETDGIPSGAYWSDYYNKYIIEGDDKYVECDLLTNENDINEYDYINNKLRLKKDATFFKYYQDYAPNDRLKNIEIIKTTHGEFYDVFKEDAIWLDYYNAYTTKDYATYSMQYSKYYKDYVDMKDILYYKNDPIFKDKAIPVYKTKKDAINSLNIHFVPEEEIDKVAYKINNNYIFKKEVKI